MTESPKPTSSSTPSIESVSPAKTAALDPPSGAKSGHPGNAPSAGPDATLIRLCAAHDLLQRQIAGWSETWSCMSDAEKEAADTMAYHIEQQQRGVLDQICALTPTTLGGYQAIARVLAALCPDLVGDAANADVDDRLMTLLVRSLIGTA